MKKVKTVLVVDDDATVVASLQYALAQAGFEVLVAADGPEALLCEDPVDLLITDLQMPHMNGRELARRFLARRPGLRIVFISADPEAEPSLTDAEFPNHVFLQKPFLPSKLIASLPRVV